jgi:hypothetical protein
VSLVSAAPTASAQTFNFETTPFGTPVPLSITNGGVAAAFASAAGFSVQPTFFGGLTGRVLRDDDAATGPLTITFSTLLSSVSLNFGLNIVPAAGNFTLVARNGATLVGTVTVAGAPPPGFLFPEGVVSFTGATFDTIVLSSTARDFAVDNIVVQPSTAIPEPGTVALFGTGLLLVSGAAARRRRAPG